MMFVLFLVNKGIKLIDMCEQLEECNRRLVKENGLQVSDEYLGVRKETFRSAVVIVTLHYSTDNNNNNNK